MAYSASTQSTSGVDWRDTFKRWSKPLSDTEEAMADRAATMIDGVLKRHPSLASRSIEVYATGSYRNNTNVRGESDIDVAVVCHDSFFYDLPPGWIPSWVGVSAPAQYGFQQFRQDVRDALSGRFSAGMTPGDKAFNVHENTYRLEADVTPFFEYRRYNGLMNVDGTWGFDEGVKSVAAGGSIFVNWHHDHYREGVAHNTQTGKRFKRVARILKNIKFEMMGSKDPTTAALARAIPSFLAECLVFNVPASYFHPGSDGYVDDVRNVLAYLWDATKLESPLWSTMMEVNRRKTLFLDGQPWQRQGVHDFVVAAWTYLF